uniref:Uncharacterized protein n=1 Tax=Glossina morsitans morsitans TaxID=37546 RepID=A0A1B0FGT5_GLOMM
MVVTNVVSLPTEEKLTVTELNLPTAALRAGAFHLGKSCEKPIIYLFTFVLFGFQEFMLRRLELDNPRACIMEGKVVTRCALDFFRKIHHTERPTPPKREKKA